MFRMLGFLPPIGFYVLSAAVMAATWSVHDYFIEAGEPVDTRIYVVGGILAFLLGFGGFQKTLENREQASRPRVSSAEVMQKLAPSETGKKDPELDGPPTELHGPSADSPLGRIRARSGTHSQPISY